MTYTEIKERNEKKYYYRVRSIRKGNKFKKNRIYLGVNLNENNLRIKERTADKKLNLEKKPKSLEINKLTPKIRKILKKNKIKRAGIFGSYARGEQKKDSDIDILVEPPKGIGFGFVGIQFELEDKLGKKVHLVTYKYIHPSIKKEILSEELRIIWREMRYYL